MINDALESGRPVLTTGWSDRFWRIIVGIEPDAGIYRVIGGVEFEESIPMADIGPDEFLPLHIKPEDCPACAIPDTDWYGAILNPAQVVKNPVFIVGGRQPVSEREIIRRTLQKALSMNQPVVISRKNLQNRSNALANGLKGHDGWKYFFSPWMTRFKMGSEGIRSWAALVEQMEKPKADFEMMHGIDTTFGGLLSTRAKDAVAWLRWAEPLVPTRARRHLKNAREKFTEIARVRIEDIGLIRTVPCYQEKPMPEKTRNDLRDMLDLQPALVYLVTSEEKELLGERVTESWESPWGWPVLRNMELFKRGKETVAANLRRIADARDTAFYELSVALANL